VFTLTTLTTDSATQTDFDAPAVQDKHVPFAYLFAMPISDPEDPITVPRLETHKTTTVHTSCDSAEWCFSFHG
jgi:hypothetical protein